MVNFDNNLARQASLHVIFFHMTYSKFSPSRAGSNLTSPAHVIGALEPSFNGALEAVDSSVFVSSANAAWVF